MRRLPIRAAVLAPLLLLSAADAAAAEMVALPDPIMTPGAVDPAATLDVVCNGTTRERRHVTSSEKAEVLAAYNIPPSQGAYYEIDHLVPLAIGGANIVANLWPQPWAEADQKDALEVELQRRVCHGLLSQAEAQREIAEGWTTAYARYVGSRPTAARIATAATAAPPTRQTFRARFKAEALHPCAPMDAGQQAGEVSSACAGFLKRKKAAPSPKARGGKKASSAGRPAPV